LGGDSTAIVVATSVLERLVAIMVRFPRNNPLFTLLGDMKNNEKKKKVAFWEDMAFGQSYGAVRPPVPFW